MKFSVLFSPSLYIKSKKTCYYIAVDSTALRTINIYSPYAEVTTYVTFHKRCAGFYSTFLNKSCLSIGCMTIAFSSNFFISEMHTPSIINTNFLATISSSSDLNFAYSLNFSSNYKENEKFLELHIEETFIGFQLLLIRLLE